MRSHKKNPKPIYTGRKALWNSGSALFQNSGSSAAIKVETTVDRYDIFAPLSDTEDLFQTFEPEQAKTAIGSEEFEQVLMSLLNPSVELSQ